ncbi:alpha/beta hydrolase [Ligilactobacillus saerimneri]|uniref:alpha/beta hydrolase n=1 Tax=Ligilactobacillus saerimneri TaxID=228229 RepID=UPI0024BB42F0|nr:alpha/beta fold hydrolase [Ligilactobacillus saerimneri]
MDEVTLYNAGQALRGIIEHPPTPSDTAVILFHGFKGNRGYQPDDLLSQLSHALVASGFTTVRFDFSGRGHSEGSYQEMTIPQEISEADTILTYTRQLPGIKHIYLLGHSLGGVIAGMLAGYYHDWIDRLVLLAPAVSVKEFARRFLRTAQTLPIMETTAQFSGPMLVIHGTDDVVIPVSAVKEYQRYCMNCEVHLVRGGSHTFKGENRSLVVQRVTEFLSRK